MTALRLLTEPGVRYRVWDTEGAPIGEAVDDDQLHRLLDELDVNPEELHQVPVTDPWRE